MSEENKVDYSEKDYEKYLEAQKLRLAAEKRSAKHHDMKLVSFVLIMEEDGEHYYPVYRVKE